MPLNSRGMEPRLERAIRRARTLRWRLSQAVHYRERASAFRKVRFGSLSEITARIGEVRSASANGHHQPVCSGPKSAITGLDKLTVLLDSNATTAQRRERFRNETTISAEAA
jgi:hypothetical protein